MILINLLKHLTNINNKGFYIIFKTNEHSHTDSCYKIKKYINTHISKDCSIRDLRIIWNSPFVKKCVNKIYSFFPI